ncbi:FKBP-type peptidyl-prolyl cis-trans isomerase [Hymenobacter sp. 15J16-1T3B]|uniref:FKBP-type peptidyl-prolyl cis-trans isomerase n=1 Tax=Hymenobacter sp. 15J16-1T3B TaxID=2886941 RepID=UPI001D10EC3A|nr:FKBP-type peptidyl-prolyl cis-trans isomerase [Hymenobacter sp. 15J16-1T3B]MCC3157913.1 FKBP-type peptidyl-prolyl cis-trans isomerase [Hymenobacter sp. 15J16-1T3B]
MRTLTFLSPVRSLLWALLPLLLVLAGCKNNSDDAAKQLAQLVEQHKAEDDATIQNYLTTNGISAGGYERRDSGLYIIWQTRTNTGGTPAAGNQVKVRYIGRYLSNDYRFEASIDNGSACGCTAFVVGSVIEGWNEVLQLMHKGDKVTILVPSHLAYGATGNGTILPFTPLKFEMELVDFTAQ